MNVDHFIVISKITSQFPCNYVYIIETTISFKNRDIYLLNRYNLSCNIENITISVNGRFELFIKTRLTRLTKIVLNYLSEPGLPG